MNSYSDQSMKVEADTQEFGIEFHADQDISLVEKMDSSSEFWKATYFKHAPDSETDYSLTLTINPVKLLYEASFIDELTKFLSTEYNSTIKQ